MTANKNSNVTIALVIENGSEVASAPLGIQFDPKVLCQFFRVFDTSA